MDAVEVAGVAVIPLIVGVVALLKELGLPSRWAPMAAVAVGVLVMALNEVLQAFPLALAVYEKALLGVALGLTAVGVHGLQKHARERR